MVGHWGLFDWGSGGLILLLLVAALIIVAVLWGKLKQSNTLYQSLQERTQELNLHQENLLAELKQAQELVPASLAKVAAAEAEVHLLKEQLQREQERTKEELARLAARYDEEMVATKERHAEALAAAESRRLSDITAIQEQQEQLRQEEHKRHLQAQNELETRLKALGETMLKERGESLQSDNHKQMTHLMAPLAQELTSFRALITTTSQQQAKQSGELQAVIQKLNEQQVSLGEQAANLTHALLQGNKSQGIWGEQQLELVLEAAGLEKGYTYHREVSVTDEEGERRRADVLVTLPNQRGIIIDAKCSLTAYTDYLNAEKKGDSKAMQTALTKHLTSVTKHIDELYERNYPKFTEYGSPDFVFMFVPIDYALALALREKPILYSEAQDKRVFLVSPSSLLPALRLVGNLWALAQQQDKFKLLATMANNIYLKCNTVCNFFADLKKNSDALSKNVDKLATSLSEGKGNLKSLLQRFANDAPPLTDQAIAEFNQDLNLALQQDQDTKSIASASLSTTASLNASTSLSTTTCLNATDSLSATASLPQEVAAQLVKPHATNPAQYELAPMVALSKKTKAGKSSSTTSQAALALSKKDQESGPTALEPRPTAPEPSQADQPHRPETAVSEQATD